MAVRRKAKKRAGRLHVRVKDDAERDAFHAYALRHGTTLTALVTEYLRSLLATELVAEDVEQI